MKWSKVKIVVFIESKKITGQNVLDVNVLDVKVWEKLLSRPCKVKKYHQRSKISEKRSNFDLIFLYWIFPWHKRCSFGCSKAWNVNVPISTKRPLSPEKRLIFRSRIIFILFIRKCFDLINKWGYSGPIFAPLRTRDTWNR